MTNNQAMTESPNVRRSFDLDARTQQFAKDCRLAVRQLPKDIFLRSDIDQLVRSSGSVAANYLEADEALSKKDFVMRIKICRKEARESRLWLNLLAEHNSETEQAALNNLQDEAYQLVKIFNAIIGKSS